MRCDGELIASIALWATLDVSAQTHQVPVGQVKQADTACKAGYAALTSNDLHHSTYAFITRLVTNAKGHCPVVRLWNQSKEAVSAGALLGVEL